MSASVPFAEVQALIKLVLDNFYLQYQRKVDPASVSAQFITPRPDTLFGFEVNTTLQDDYLKIRIYANNFTTNGEFKPFRQEDLQGTDGGLGTKAFVSISELSINLFPNLMRSDNPSFDNTAGPYAIELEDSSGYIQAEDNSFLTLENSPT